MREQLLGYLMGALDASQQSEVEQALQTDPRLRQELELLHQALEPLRADRGLYEPPCGLADRTLDAVGAVAGWPDESELAQDQACEVFEKAIQPAAGRAQAAFSSSHENPAGLWASRWAVLDVLASVAVVATAAMLFFPAVANSRFQARLAACQSNLQSLVRAMHDYSDNHQDQFVAIPPEGNLSFAGVYAPTLRDEGYATEESVFHCAGDPALHHSESVRRQRIPTISEIERAVGAELRRMQREAGGSFGYDLGYLVNGEYSPVRNLRRSTFPILADAPGSLLNGRISLNHEGRGLNVAYEDGHVKYLPAGYVAAIGDDIFHSDRGLIEPGQHPDDAVIGNSHSRPILISAPASR
jgi:hypothetical protein